MTDLCPGDARHLDYECLLDIGHDGPHQHLSHLLLQQMMADQTDRSTSPVR